jgi:hypothetical protein
MVSNKLPTKRFAYGTNFYPFEKEKKRSPHVPQKIHHRQSFELFAFSVNYWHVDDCHQQLAA